MVLDAYAILAFLLGERSADEVASLLREPTVLSAVNAAEVVDLLTRRHRRDPDDVHADLALLTTVGLVIGEVTPEIGFDAGRLRAKHYHRQRCPVSMADCVAAAMALTAGRPLVTADAALADVILAAGGDVHPLPDSNGIRPYGRANNT